MIVSFCDFNCSFENSTHDIGSWLGKHLLVPFALFINANRNLRRKKCRMNRVFQINLITQLKITF